MTMVQGGKTVKRQKGWRGGGGSYMMVLILLMMKLNVPFLRVLERALLGWSMEK